MKKCLIISNPRSGNSNKKDCREQIINRMIFYGYDPIFIPTEFRNHARAIAKNVENIDLVISEGGDGTLHEVLAGNISRKDSLLQAHIPTGTTNDVGKMYGMPKDTLSCIDEIMNGDIKEVDYFQINKEPFVYVAGAGQFLHIPYTTTREEKDKLGHLAYIKNGVKSWIEGTKDYDITYEIDGKEYNDTSSIMLITNSTRIAGFNDFYKKDYVKLDDGLFEVVLVNTSSKMKLFKSATNMIAKGVSTNNGLKVFQTDNFKIRFNNKLLYNPCIDGEELKQNTNEYLVEPSKKIKMLLPNKNINKLFSK